MGVDTEKLDKVLASHRVEIAYLFGSLARGEAGPLSDADVGVLFEEKMEPQARFHAKLMLTSELPSIFGVKRIDVVDLVNAPPALAFHVIKDATVLRNLNESRRIRFESRTMIRYWDTAPMRRKFQEAILDHYLGKRP